MDTLKRLGVFALLIFCAWSTIAQPRTWGLGKETQTLYGCYYGGTAPSAPSCHAKDWAEILRGFSDPNATQTAVSNVNATCAPAGAENSFRCVTTFMRQFRYPGAPPPYPDSFTATYLPATVQTCPGNSSEVATTGPCTCHVGFEAKMEGGKTKCVPYTCPAAGGYSPVTQPDVQLSADGDACYQGCAMKPHSVKSSPDGKLWATWPYVSRGKACGGADPVTKDVTFKPKETGPEAPIACGASKCPGTVNGTHVCVPCSGVTVPGVSTSASGISNTTPGGPNLPDGGTSTSSTTCNESTCTTTTTVTDKNGNSVGTATQEKPKESFCQENPQLQICKDGRWGGNCGGGYTCDGDAVQCAMAREIHTRNCQLYDTPNALSEIGSNAMNSEAVPEGHPGKNAQTKDLGSIFKPLEGNAACITDKTVSMGGRSVVLPFSQVCDPLRWMGHIAFAFALVHGAFLVFRKL